MDEHLPPELDRGRHAELRGRERQPIARRLVLAVLLAIVVLALANVFGQGARTSGAAGSDATLTVSAPARIRGGLFFQGRLEVVARHALARPTLVLGPGWTEELQINTIEPAPGTEGSSGGRLVLGYDRLAAGERLTVWMQFEANPLATGRRDQSVELRDGPRRLARIDRTITVFP